MCESSTQVQAENIFEQLHKSMLNWVGTIHVFADSVLEDIRRHKNDEKPHHFLPRTSGMLERPRLRQATTANSNRCCIQADITVFIQRYEAKTSHVWQQTNQFMAFYEYNSPNSCFECQIWRPTKRPNLLCHQGRRYFVFILMIV